MSFNFRWKGLARQSGNSCVCGCVVSGPCPFCTGATMPQLQVTFAGFHHFALSSDCGATPCGALNASFLLPFIGSTSGDPSNPSCAWRLSQSIPTSCAGFSSGGGTTIIQATLAYTTPPNYKLDVVANISFTGHNTGIGGSTLTCTTILEWIKTFSNPPLGPCSGINYSVPFFNGSDSASPCNPVCDWGNNASPTVTCNVLAV